MTERTRFTHYEEILVEMGLERTRENYLWLIYNGEVPEEFDYDDEQVLPPDLRIIHDE